MAGNGAESVDEGFGRGVEGSGFGWQGDVEGEDGLARVSSRVEEGLGIGRGFVQAEEEEHGDWGCGVVGRDEVVFSLGKGRFGDEARDFFEALVYEIGTGILCQGGEVFEENEVCLFDYLCQEFGVLSQKRHSIDG